MRWLRWLFAPGPDWRDAGEERWYPVKIQEGYRLDRHQRKWVDMNSGRIEWRDSTDGACDIITGESRDYPVERLVPTNP
jgi:hypothetical protein